MFVMSRHFLQDALNTLKAMPLDQVLAEIPDARGFFVCRGETIPEGYAFLEHVREGDLVGTLCQRK